MHALTSTGVAVCGGVLLVAGAARADRAGPCVPLSPLTRAATKTIDRDTRGVEQQVIVARDGSRQEIWTYFVDHRQREVDRGPEGKIHAEMVTSRGLSIFVDYDARQWMTSPAPSGVQLYPATLPEDLVRMYRTEVADKQATTMGDATIQGIATIHIRQIETIPPPTRSELKQEAAELRQEMLRHLPKGFKLPKGFPLLVTSKSLFPIQHLKIDTWLNAKTYLPVLTRTVRNGYLFTTEYDAWLPNTAQNVAKTHVVIPTGFTSQNTTNIVNGGGFAIASSASLTQKPTGPPPACQAP